MPSYDYVCPECKQVIEIEKSMDSTEDFQCPKCNTKLTRVFSTPAFLLKGEGFYKPGHS